MIADRTLVLVRERTVLDVLDLALEVIRTRPRPIVVAALVGILPFAALNSWVLTLPGIPIGEWWGLIVIEAPLATAPLTVVLGDLMFGRKRRVREVVRTLAKAIGPLLFYQVLLRTLLLLTCVFGILIPLRMSFLNPVILLEPRSRRKHERKWFQAIRRSSLLSGDRGADLFAIWFAQFAFGALFLIFFRLALGALWTLLIRGTLSGGIPNLEDDAFWNDLFCGPRTQAGAWILIAFFAVTQFLTYIDQRGRLEGWSVELKLSDVARGLEEDGRDRGALPTLSRPR